MDIFNQQWNSKCIGNLVQQHRLVFRHDDKAEMTAMFPYLLQV